MTFGLRDFFAILTMAGLMMGCSVPDESGEYHDPYETANREVHAFNKTLDRAVLRPASRAYGEAVPAPIKSGLTNFAENLDTPRYIVNDVLQGEVADGVHNFFRFIINSTLGIAGIFDPAGSIGLEPRESDFGQTLHVWGTDEGAYLELPVFGPSTERDAVGLVADFMLNPLTVFENDIEPWVRPTSTAVQVVDLRYRLGADLDFVLYESADSYAQARILYLQNRRFELGGGETEYFDPYEDLAFE